MHLLLEKLLESGQAPAKEFTDKEISKWLGFSSIDMWNSFMPNLKEDENLNVAILSVRI